MTEPEPFDWEGLDQQEPPDDEPTVTPPAAPVIPASTPTSDPAAQGERAMVLRHPDIAKRLCDPPQRYAQPEQWNGYIPPATWREQPNGSPVRRQLLEIVTAAVQADKEKT